MFEHLAVNQKAVGLEPASLKHMNIISKIINLTFEIINLFTIIIPILLAVALLTLLERKVLGYTQYRKGPKLIGPLGILQPIADGLKLFIKENFKPSIAKLFIFYISPIIFFLISLLLWGVAPISNSGLNLKLSLLFVIALSSLSVYPILTAGWSSNSKYALLGAIRGAAQIISYEVSFSLILLPIIFIVGKWKLKLINRFKQFKLWLIIPCPLLFIMWFISTLAETNRSPFDLAEGESELVSGYNVEYSGAPFALFFIGEYRRIIFINLISSILFFGKITYTKKFLLKIIKISIKTSLLIFIFLWIRTSFPRIRYDQLMMLMWKKFLPLILGLLKLYYILIIIRGNFPSYYN